MKSVTVFVLGLIIGLTFGKIFLRNEQSGLNKVPSHISEIERRNNTLLQTEWSRVTKNMTVEELVKTVGTPVVGASALISTKERPNTVFSPHYPPIFEGEYFGQRCSFSPRKVYLRGGKVIGVNESGFNKGANYNLDKPEKVELVSYCNEFQYELVKNSFIDFRWLLARGAYPMRYEIEFRGPEKDDVVNLRTINPYCSFKALKCGRYEWRVRAINKFGDGEWSELETFFIK